MSEAILLTRAALRRTTLAKILVKDRGPLVAAAMLLALFALISIVGSGSLSYYDFQTIVTNGATLAIAAMGQTLVILTGGFDLSAGSVVSLVNVLLAAHSANGNPYVWAGAGIGAGALVGAFNGFFVAVLGLQPIVVTLSTMFITQGITLLVMDKPGGTVAPKLGDLLTGDLVPNAIPTPLGLLVLLVCLWIWLKRSRLGIAIYATGSDSDAARAAGIRTAMTRFLVYTMAGGLYGLAGVFISAETGSGDPLVGNPMLLQVFAAVVVGGTLLGGGRGGPVGSIFGAYILLMMVNLLLVLNVSAYYSTVAEGSVLILAMLVASLGAKSKLNFVIGQSRTRLSAWRRGLLPYQTIKLPTKLTFSAHYSTGEMYELKGHRKAGLFVRNRELLRYLVPPYIGFAIILVITECVLGNTLLNVNYYNEVIVLSSFLAVLALGQGAAILSGGLDLSVPWTIALSGILLTGVVNGHDSALIYGIPLILCLGAGIGFVNGLGIAVLGLPPIVMTLAMNGILQGVALVYLNGGSGGYAGPLLRWFMNGRIGIFSPIGIFMIGFVGGAVLLLGRTPFGRRIYAIGNGERVATLSGVPITSTLLGVYMLSGFCSALVAIMLTGFSGQASLGVGDDYLLPSIAVVVVGGTLITGGRGHYLAMLGGVLLLVALQTFLAGTTAPYAMRAILYGIVILGAVLAQRERQS
jgi:ribose transport system permease protein